MQKYRVKLKFIFLLIASLSSILWCFSQNPIGAWERYYEDEKGNMGFRILKLEDRTKPHKANLNDDYEFIKKYAVNEKQVKEMDKWVTKIAKNSYIKVDDLYKGCPKISKWNLNF